VEIGKSVSGGYFDSRDLEAPRLGRRRKREKSEKGSPQLTLKLEPSLPVHKHPIPRLPRRPMSAGQQSILSHRRRRRFNQFLPRFTDVELVSPFVRTGEVDETEG